MRKTCINSKLLRLTLEKMVIGVEEPILIKGIGEIVAKVDSGNSGYNVIHGEDLIVQGNILTFKTENKDGKESEAEAFKEERWGQGGYLPCASSLRELRQEGTGEYCFRKGSEGSQGVSRRPDCSDQVWCSKDFGGYP